MSAQDVIYVISGNYNGEIITLDSIIIDNISNGTSVSFSDLPEHNYYQINLSKNAYWGTVSAFDLEEPAMFNVQENTPGQLLIGYTGLTSIEAEISVINIYGQTLISRNNLFLFPQNSLQVKLGSGGVYFVKIKSSKENKTFKAIGGVEKSGYSIEIYKGGSKRPFSIETLKSTTLIGGGEFHFQEGDSIRIWAFGANKYALPAHMRIKESGEVDFNFEDIQYRTEPEQAYPDSVGEMIYFQVDGENFQCRRVNDLHIFQGDILLTEAQISNESTKGVSLNSESPVQLLLDIFRFIL